MVSDVMRGVNRKILEMARAGVPVDEISRRLDAPIVLVNYLLNSPLTAAEVARAG